MSSRDDQRYLAEFVDAFSRRVGHFPHEVSGAEGQEFLYFQKIANEKMLRAIREGERNRLSVLLACGAGKTRLGLNAVAASQEAKRRLNINGKRKDFFLTVEVGIADQAYQEARSFGMEPGRWFGGRRELEHSFVIGTIQALQANIARGRRHFRRIIPPNTTDLLICDEADCHLTEKREKVREELQPRMAIALTATGEWPDGRSVEDEEAFGPAVETIDLKDAMLQGICAVPDIYFYESEIPGDQIGIREGDYAQNELVAAWKQAELHLAIPAIYRKVIPKAKRKLCPTLIYVPSVNMVAATVETMQQEFGNDITIEGLAGAEVKPTDQQRLTQEFREGALHALVLCRRGGRGWNLENTILVIDAFPTYSLNKITHQDCRGLRKILPGSEMWRKGCRKEEAVLIQIVPKSLKRRPALFTDALGGFQQYLAVREKRRPGPGVPGSDLVDEIRRNIEAGEPDHRLHLVKHIHALEAIDRLEELYTEDPTGFFSLPSRYTPHG